MSNFTFSLSPIELSPPGLAVAGLRAGSSAWLDAEHLESSAEAIEAARRNLALLGAERSGEAWPGLRLTTDQVEELGELLLELASGESGGGHWLVLTAGDTPLDEAVAALPPAAERRVLWEINDAEQLSALDPRSGDGGAIDGIVARGSECGGWIGTNSSFILTQRLANAGLDLPFYVQGAMGPAGAAACRLAGASGVVVADELLLMPESPLPGDYRQALHEVNGTETPAIGEALGRGCRVFMRPHLPAAVRMREVAKSLEKSAGAAGRAESDLRRAARELVGWGPPETNAWPIGQGIALAESLRRRFRSTGRLLQAMDRASETLLEAAAEEPPLAPGSAFARSHGLRFPIVQGPMTRVSDTPKFAEAVSAAGGLPLLALALMREDETRNLLQQTRERLGERPWGVGILGFVPRNRREEQLRAIVEIEPDFALIAGGRPDQAAELEEHGVATYLHVPVPGLLRRFLDQGCRRFVFEGRECGGHIGPLSSFALWQVMTETLLGHCSDAVLREVRLLYAGGIHDSLSAAMVSAQAAPLTARGVEIGVILGSAYLFTREAVETGAVSEAFQREAVECRRTTTLRTGVGHIIRCAPTAFVEEFEATRLRLLESGAPTERMRSALDALGLGRARLASKGLVRDGNALLPVDEERQRREGMFMMGQLATLRDSVVSMADLHESLCAGSVELLTAAAGLVAAAPAPVRQPMPAEIAIVGMSCLLPGARDLDQYWQNLLDLPELITEVPRHRWDWRLMYSEDPKAPDTTTSKWGGFFDEVPFDPLRFGIPPNSMRFLSTSQLLALEVVRWALTDAGYEQGDFDRENTAVIVGIGANGDQEQHYLVRTLLPLVVENLTEDDLRRLPQWTEESFAGVLANVTAGRIANRFDLGGANYTVDAACASGLTVIDLAISELRNGRSQMVIAAGLDFEQTPYFFQGFSRVKAVSPRGRARTFDRDADGIVISEGMAVVMLKRLDDAVRDGDRIYGVIQAAAGSSDGKALGMTAPRSIGQRRALRRAYEEAGLSPARIGLYEAHGTGTPVGDKAEAETIYATLQQHGARGKSCAVGSVKSLLGHTKAAAGLVGLVKATLALHYRTLPPHANVENPLPELAEPDSPLYLLREPRPWLASDGEPRSAGVSAFGFGGTNCHAVVQEYQDPLGDRAPGGDRWPCELFVFRAATRDELEQEVRRALAVAASGREVRRRDLAYAIALRAEKRRNREIFLGVLAEDGEALVQVLEGVADRLQAGSEDPVGPAGRVGWQSGATRPVAFLFPGQGSQAPNMLRDAVLYRRELRRALEDAERSTEGCFEDALGQIVYPPHAFTADEAERQRARVNATQVAQPAIGALSLGLFDFLRALRVEAEMVAGHSYGELTALCAAGAIARSDFIRLSERRGHAMAQTRDGGMVAVGLGGEEAEALLAELGDENGAGLGVVVANRNAPDQTVLSGPAEAIDRLVAHLKERSIRAHRLPVSGAFHSALMEPAAAPLREAIADLDIAVPSLPVFSNQTAAPYPSSPEDVSAHLGEHLLSPVDFVGQIESMYDVGARVFVEVGPGRVLTGLVGRILGERAHTAVSLDAGKGMNGLLLALGQLAATGIDVKFTALFEGRECQPVDLREEAQPVELPATLWYVDGGRVRKPDGQFAGTGELPLLSYEKVQQARERRASAATAAATTAAEAGLESATRRSAAAAVQAAGSAAAEHLAADPAAVGFPGNGRPHALRAYESYQETMRRFLATQQAVMAQVLGAAGDSASLSLPAPPPQLAADNAPSSAPAAPPEVPIESDHDTGAGTGLAPLAAAEPEAQAAAVPEAAVPLALSAGSLDRERLSAALTALISERTGYPEDTLDADLDLEADLGVDSIKRLEILEAIARELPVPVQEVLQDRLEELVREKTLASWAAAIERLSATVVSSAKASDGAEPEGEPEAASAARAVVSCQRYVIRGRDRVLEQNNGHLEGPIVVTEDELGIARQVAESLEARGVRALILDRRTLGEPGGAIRWLEESGLLGPVAGLVHLAPIANGGTPSIECWRARTEIEVKSLFDLLQSMARSGCFAATGGPRFRALAATLLGGSWGRSGKGSKAGAGSASSGGVYGVLKTLASEYDNVAAKVVDFDQTMAPETIGQTVLGELAQVDGSFEIGYSKDRRRVFDAEPAPIETATEATDLLPRDGWVVLVTGGGRGITAELTCRLAAPGVRFVIVGRSPQPGPSDPELSGLAESELRARLIERRRSEGQPVSPSEIEKEVLATLKESEARSTLARLEAAGAVVEYVVADVRTDLEAAIDGVYERHGRLDAVLHGAGVVEDKLFVDKERASFDRVFDTKADSSFALALKLRPEGLRWVVLMSSISGRIGNRGQVDYAAGNEVMNRVAWQMSRELAPARVLAINWGPWTGAGMANDGVLRELASRGIPAIDLETGWQFLRRELLDRSGDAVEVIAGSYPDWG